MTTYNDFLVCVIDHGNKNVDEQDGRYYHVRPEVDFPEIFASTVRGVDVVRNDQAEQGPEHRYKRHRETAGVMLLMFCSTSLNTCVVVNVHGFNMGYNF